MGKKVEQTQTKVYLTVCSCHVTCVFQSESTLYSCLNVKELLAQSRHEIWTLSDTLVKKHSTIWPSWPKLAKWLSVRLQIKGFWVRFQLLSLKVYLIWKNKLKKWWNHLEELMQSALTVGSPWQWFGWLILITVDCLP